MSNARLIKEIKTHTTSPVPGTTVSANESNILEWTINFTGPSEYNTGTEIRPCPYGGAVIPAKVTFPANYPFKSPTISFPSGALWHPQVEFKTGVLCVLELEKTWAPVKTVVDVIKFVQNILGNPSGDGALEIEAAKQLKENITDYEKKAAASCASFRS